MIIVADYLKKLLYEQDCVVVPELGGFISHFSHAYFNNLNGQYYAPFKRIAFNEALKLDDGLLGQYISVNEQISREDANKEVCLFTENVKSNIKTNGRFYINNLGVLMLNEDGKFLFEPELGVNYFQEGFGLTTVPAKMVASHKVFTEKSIEFETNDREAIASQQMASTNRHRSRSRITLITGGLILAGILFYAASDITPSNSFRSSLNPFDIFVSNNNESQVNTDIKPIQKIVTKIVEEPKHEQIPVEKVEDTKIVEKIVVTPIVVETKKALLSAVTKKIAYGKVDVKSDDSANYFVIAGAFANKENADKLTEKLKLNGFLEANVMPIDTRNLYKVSVVGFSTASRASQKIAKVNSIAKANAWVLHTK